MRRLLFAPTRCLPRIGGHVCVGSAITYRLSPASRQSGARCLPRTRGAICRQSRARCLPRTRGAAPSITHGRVDTPVALPWAVLCGAFSAGGGRGIVTGSSGVPSGTIFPKFSFAADTHGVVVTCVCTPTRRSGRTSEHPRVVGRPRCPPKYQGTSPELPAQPRSSKIWWSIRRQPALHSKKSRQMPHHRRFRPCPPKFRRHRPVFPVENPRVVSTIRFFLAGETLSFEHSGLPAMNRRISGDSP